MLELLEENDINNIKIKRLGISDSFVPHGSRERLLKHLGLTTGDIVNACLALAGHKRKKISWLQSGKD